MTLNPPSDELATALPQPASAGKQHRIRTRRARYATVLLAFALLALLWSFVRVQINQERGAVGSQETAKNTGLAALEAEHAARTLQGYDQLLRLLRDDHAQRGVPSDLRRRVIAAGVDLHLIRNLMFFDAHGTLMSDFAGTRSVSAVDRSFFKAHASDSADRLLIGEPYFEGEGKLWSIALSRRLYLADGAFAGVVLIAVKPEFFVSIDSNAEPAVPRTISLIGLDGITRAQRRGDQTSVGEDQRNTQLFQELRRSPSQGNFISTADVEPAVRSVSYRVLETHRLVVVVDSSLSAALATVQGRAHTLVAMAGAGSLLIISLAAVLLNALRRHQVSVKLLNATSQHLRSAVTALQSSESSLKEAQRIGQMGSYVVDIANDRWESSETLDAIFGIDAPFERSIESWSQLMAPGYEQKMYNYFRQVVTERSRFAMAYPIVRPCDGELRWIESSGELTLDATGMPLTLHGTILDISARKAAELELDQYRQQLENLVSEKSRSMEQSSALMRSIFETQQDLIWLKDPQGVYLAVNPMFARLHGREPQDIVGKRDTDLCAPELAAHIHATDLRALHSNQPVHDEMWLSFAVDGRRALFDRVNSLVRDDTGHVLGVLGIGRDITDRKATEDAAHAANHAKSDFLAKMSHEIRTPMNGVIGMLDVLRETPLTPAQLRMLGTVHDSSLSLMRILNDILDYSKIEAGKLDLELVPTRLVDLAESVIQLLVSTAQAKDVTLSLVVATELPPWALSDPTRLRQIMLNLLGNAVKFTGTRAGRPGRVQLSVQAVAGGAATPALQLRFTDNGIGMAPDVLAQAFAPFAQADASTARKFGGTGLGLSITKQLVALLGGTITVTSVLGEGTQFCVDLPWQPCPPGPAEAQAHATGITAAPSGGGALRRPRILLAEDNEINRDVMFEQLRLLGYEADVAPDGEQALALWQNGRYALLLTDCHMPRLDGFELTEAIRRAEPTGTRRPIIAVTANAMQGEAQHCLERGMDDYLAKPLRLAELGRMLAKWLPAGDVPSPELPD